MHSHMDLMTERTALLIAPESQKDTRKSYTMDVKLLDGFPRGIQNKVHQKCTRRSVGKESCVWSH